MTHLSSLALFLLLFGTFFLGRWSNRRLDTLVSTDHDRLVNNKSHVWIPFSNNVADVECIDQQDICLFARSIMRSISVQPCFDPIVYRRVMSMNQGELCDGVFISAHLLQQAAGYRLMFSGNTSTPVIVLVEGRNTSNIVPVIENSLLNIIEFAPSSWRIRLFVQQPINEHLQTLDWFLALSRVCDKIVVHLLESSWSQPSSGRYKYNKLLSTQHFWRALNPASHVQIVELDSGFCPNSTRSLEQYTQFDYCGARWLDNNPGACIPNKTYDASRCVGNSGFSIWNRQMMVKVTHKYANIVHRSSINIDQDWGPRLRESFPDIKICSPMDADLYAVETTFADPLRVPIGWHKPFFHLWSSQQRDRFHLICPTYEHRLSIQRNATRLEHDLKQTK